MKTTYHQKIENNWLLIDGQDRILGRLAAETARLLRGKHKINWAPHLDAGDFVVIINADKIRLSGKKWTQKSYYTHSRYIGSLKEKTASMMRPELLIQKAVRGMLSKNKLRDKMMKKLKIYKGGKHPHQAQKPTAFKF